MKFNLARITLTGAILTCAFASLVAQAEPSLADDEKMYMPLAAETIKKFEDAPAAQQEEFITQEMNRFARKYPRGYIYLRASIRAWQADPEAYHAKWPKIFAESKDEFAPASIAPKTVTPGMMFLNEAVQIENDSEWKILAAITVGKNLRSTNPLIGGLTTEGRYVFVIYTAKNLTGKPQTILASPQLSDAEGNTYDALHEESLYSEALAGAKTITIEQLPNKLAKKFAAIYELPEDPSVLYFNARQLGKTIAPEIKRIVLVDRPSVAIAGAAPSTTSAGVALKSVGKRLSFGGRLSDDPIFKPEDGEIYVVVRLSFSADREYAPDVALKHPSGLVLNPAKVTSFFQMDEYATNPRETGYVFSVPKELGTKNDWMLQVDDPKIEIPIKLAALSADSDRKNSPK